MNDPTPSREAWLPRLNSRPDARVRLYCFSHAGGGASAYYPWIQALPASIEVCPIQLPGREERLNEARYEDFEALMADLVPLIAETIDRPFAIYGHSLGANVGYEVAKRLLETYALSPAGYFGGALRSPSLPYDYPSIQGQPDDKLVETVMRFNGLPEALLRNEELMSLVLPILRSDLLLCESYRYQARVPLSCPMVIFNGRFDKNVSPERLAPWRQHSTGAVEFKTFDGDHFFLKTHGKEVLDIIANQLKQALF